MTLAANKIHQGDCVKRLRQIEPGSIDLAFADPPFNIGYDYDIYDDNRSAEEYVEWSRKWIEGVFQALKPDGTFWLAIGDEFAAELKLTAQKTGFHCRSWVIWYYTFGVNCKRGFSRSHTHLFHFVKNPRGFTFNDANPAVRVPSARQMVYADARANSKGRLPDNTWILRPQDVPAGFPAEHDTWYFSRVAGTFKEREGFHGCQMPEQLLGRIIRISSSATDIVLDPFAGSGTTLAVAHKLGRQWMGIELSHEYVRRIRERLRDVRVGDRLDGPEDPLRSAPTTRQGKTRGVLPSSARRRGPRSAKAARVREDVTKGVVAAYKASHKGFSTDYLLADPELNEGFVAKCLQLGIPGDATIWNETLLRVRKQGQLPKLAKARRHKTYREMDAYSFASEVALHQLSVDFEVTLDGILCDPELAALFDKLARSYSYEEHEPFEYRWAALALRKRAKLAKQQAGKHKRWLRVDDLPKLDRLARASYDKSPGVYELVGRSKRSIYVGETYDLSEKIAQIRATDAWMELEPASVRVFRPNEKTMLGLKSVLIQRTDPALNSRLLFPGFEIAA